MRKITLKYVLTFMLMLCVLVSGSLVVLAANEVNVSVNSVEVSPGETVTTQVIMEGTFAAFQGRLIYDTEALTLEKIEATDAISGSMTMFNQDDITDEFLNGSFASASASNMDVDGAVLTFTFKAGSSASGTYSFSIEQFLVYDEAGTELTVNAVDTVVEKETLETQQTTTSSQGTSSQGSSNQDTPNSDDSDKNTTSSGIAGQEDPSTSESEGAGQDSDGGNSIAIVLIVVPLVVVAAVVAVFIVRSKKADGKTDDTKADDDE